MPILITVSKNVSVVFDSPITVPSQDMILGCYYLTHPGTEDRSQEADKGDGKCFADMDELMMAYQAGIVGIHAKVKVRVKLNDEDQGKLVE